jgi:hypothetical protein
MVGDFSVFMEFRGDDSAQVFKLPGEVDVFPSGRFMLLGIFKFSFLSSLVSMTEGGGEYIASVLDLFFWSPVYIVSPNF